MAATIILSVRQQLQTAGLRPDDLLVVGLSGGIDSLVLTHALADLGRRGWAPRIHAVHVDHRLRSDSEFAAERVRGVVRRLDLPLTVVRVDVAAWNARLGQGVEAAARAARYAALAQVARELGTSWIAVGHTLDDQTETVLLRLARGSGLEGLAAMRPVAERAIALNPESLATHQSRIVRPLLRTRRAEIERYAARHRLVPIEDPTNAQTRFTRNRIRHEVLPALEDAVPGAAGAIARAADLMAADADFLASAVAEAYASVVSAVSGVLRIDRAALAALHPALQGRVLAAAVRQLDVEVALTRERIEALLTLVLAAPPSRTIQLGGGAAARSDYDGVVLGREARLDDRLRAISGLPLLESGREMTIERRDVVSLLNGWELAVEPPTGALWLLRTRRPGDRISLDGGELVRLQDWLVNRRVPGYVRDWLPLIVQDGVVRWVAGVSSSDDFAPPEHGFARLAKSRNESELEESQGDE